MYKIKKLVLVIFLVKLKQMVIFGICMGIFSRSLQTGLIFEAFCNFFLLQILQYGNDIMNEEPVQFNKKVSHKL